VAVVVISESGSETISRRRFNQILWARRAGRAIEHAQIEANGKNVMEVTF